MADSRQNDQFAKELLPTWPLDAALDWITSNMNIDDVYDTSEILDWVTENYDVEGVFDDDRIKEYVKKSLLPEDVFSEEQMQAWASENGYVLSD